MHQNKLNIGELKTKRMNKEEILYWCDKYNTNPNPSFVKGKRIEQEVGKSLRKNKKLSIEELKMIIEWKYPNKGARGNLKRADKIPNETVELITETALKIEDDKCQVNVLTALDGIGIATASAILAFYDPENYGVGDRYIMADFFGKNEGRAIGMKDYLAILKRLHEEKELHSLKARDIEKAYYIRYLVLQDKRILNSNH